MIALITWTTYGTWLAGPARGWIERNVVQPTSDIPEPDSTVSTERRRSLHWPIVELDGRQRQRVVDDIDRLAALRQFRPVIAVVACDHVHLLVEIDDRRDLARFVQLVKGSLSRTLTCGEGDPPPEDRPHHKWWAGHYSVHVLASSTEATVRGRLQRHDDAIIRTFS